MGGVSRFLILLRTPLLYNCSSTFRLARHSRVPLALIPYAQNRNLFSNSNPQLGFNYEQLHTQTARINRGDLYGDSSSGVSPNSSGFLSHWPEWSNLVGHLRNGGYFDRESSSVELNGAFGMTEHMPEEFIRAASACLSFARDYPHLLGSLSKKDIEVVVKDGSPFLLSTAGDSVNRMQSFLGFTGRNVLEFDEAHTADLMYYLLNHASNHVAASDGDNFSNREHVESSVRNLLGELANASRTVRALDLSGSMSTHFTDRHGQTPRPLGQSVEMKRGDWICPKCNFMNFARNTKCRECDEARTNGLVTGTSGSTSGVSYSFGRNTNDTNIRSRLAANEEKAERWYSKVSQLDNGSDLSTAIADEDFPEIMPLRKGVNRFVVSTRKTPLERRLANAHYRRNLGNGGTLEEKDIQLDDRMSPAETSNFPVSQRLDRILGRSSTVPGTDNNFICFREQNGDRSSFSSSGALQNEENKGSSSSYAPFVPLPSDTFAESQNSKVEEEQVAQKGNSVAAKVDELTSNSDSRNTDSGKSGYSVAELESVTGLPSGVSADDFPDIMPMRKGENRFVVSKKRDRSLTSPLHKRRVAMEQTDIANVVPFVPFPPDYFAKKKNEPEAGSSIDNARNGTSTAPAAPQIQHAPERLDQQKTQVYERGADANSAKWLENHQSRRESWNAGFSNPGMEAQKVNSFYGAPSRNSSLKPDDLQSSKRDNWNAGSSQQPENYWNSGVKNVSGNSSKQPENSWNSNESWNRGSSAKSLEGSAVKELDPLDMSEEAKAERWFRRVAQIKDISELSNIPDEDFPEIMPMRKGVNRFVVSKRKTPLERRLTSPQYRRNLPIITQDPIKKDNDTN